ncbi:MAG: sulfatase-like hydrolase/transferase [Bacteroidaceae bacterium]|nr:sulfatase-like hydrolase/transferase [Bacteroidaceae bacterium]
MKTIKTFFQILVLWTLVGTLGHLLFLAIYNELLSDATRAERMLSLLYALKLDIAVAGYLTIIPALMLLLRERRGMKLLWNAYFIVIAAIYALAIVSNLGLYGPWGFPLDYTPVLYLTTSPADAMASVTPLQMLAAAVGIAVITAAVYLARPQYICAKNKTYRIAIFILTVALILPIRGGVGTGTNHTGTVYFSENMRFNHAAVNPVFCFIESASHQTDLSSLYRFMSDEEADKLLKELNQRTDSAEAALRDSLFNGKPKRIVMVILESFSTQLMEEAGLVEGVVPQLEKLSREGIYFTEFYCNTMRTDRALVSVLSSIPAFPTYSLMDQPSKNAKLPSIASVLKNDGFHTYYYYGGDTNFSNMRSYLVAAGFQDITSDKSFSKKLRTGKWGVADGPVFDRAAKEFVETSGEKSLSVVQTSSSHEPFDVPNHHAMDDKVLNAFHYADSCLGRFVEKLKESRDWGETLVVILPDHQGRFPTVVNNYTLEHYDLPLIFTGGVVRKPCKVETLCSQADITATLLGLLGIGHEEFPWSKDIFDCGAPHYAVFAVPDAVGMVREEGAIIWDNSFQRVMLSTYPQGQEDKPLMTLKAYYQELYKTADEL